MKALFKRAVVERELIMTGWMEEHHDFHVGDLIEYPFKGRVWRVVALTDDTVRLDDDLDAPVAR